MGKGGNESCSKKQSANTLEEMIDKGVFQLQKRLFEHKNKTKNVKDLVQERERYLVL